MYGYQTYQNVCTVGEKYIECSAFNRKHWSIHKNRKWLTWDRWNYIFVQKWLGRGLYNWPQNRLLWWGRGSERPATHTQQRLAQVPPFPAPVSCPLINWLLALAITRYCSMLACRVGCIGIIMHIGSMELPSDGQRSRSSYFLTCLFITVAENNCNNELTGNVHCQC